MDRTFLGVAALLCGGAYWTFELLGRSDVITAKWFLAHCIFVASWSVVAAIERKG
jgi:hypothetical protein